MTANLSRRRFLLAGTALGGGLLLGYGLIRARDLLGDAAILPVTADEIALNAWLKIDRDGYVTVAVPRAEMGQGVHTALPTLVAEELDLPWGLLRVMQAPLDGVYGNITVVADSIPLDPHDPRPFADLLRWTFTRTGRALGLQITGASTSVRDTWLPLRSAGAAAREMLLRAAAARLDVAPGELTTGDGRVHHLPSARSLGYGDLAAAAAGIAPPRAISLRAQGPWRHLGQARPRLDVPAKVDGSARYGIDVRTADMVYASLRLAPAFGARLVHDDRAALAARPEVLAVVPLGDDGVAVVAPSWWQAERALDAARLEFSAGTHPTLSNADFHQAFAAAIARGPSRVYDERGDARGELRGPDVIRAEYRVPLLAHACMEPMNCTVRLDTTGVDIWIGNQAPDLLRNIAATALDLPRARVRLHTPYLGGGFGRRFEPDVLRRALDVARAVPGRTVQLIYPRAEDLRHDTYRPPALARCAARLTGDGRIGAWHLHAASPSVTQAVLGRAFPRLPRGGPDRTNVEGAAWLAYAIPHWRIEHSAVPIVPPVGYWRSVGHSFNAFFTECFIDELAQRSDADPIAFRLRHLRASRRESAVLRHLRALSGWDEPVAAGRARGVALHESFHSIVGQVAEIRIDDQRIVVERVTCVIDCGQVVNPDIVIAQMESGIVFGLSAALFGEVAVTDGRVQATNFTDYRVLGLADMPRIETHVIASGGPPGGVGEPGTPPIAPAVANALARLTGVRQRSLPLRVGAS